jgi:hypothetical protein
MNTYGIPIHCLEPFENGTRYLSSFLAVVGLSHRSGSNLSGLGKITSFRCIMYELIPTFVLKGVILIQLLFSNIVLGGRGWTYASGNCESVEDDAGFRDYSRKSSDYSIG